MLITNHEPLVFKITSMQLLESTDLPVSYDPAVNVLLVLLFSLKLLFGHKQLMNIWGACWFSDHLIKKGNQFMVTFWAKAKGHHEHIPSVKGILLLFLLFTSQLSQQKTK